MTSDFPTMNSVSSDGNDTFPSFDATVTIPALTPSNQSTYTHGLPLRVQVNASPDAPVTPGFTAVVDVVNLNVGGVFKASTAPLAGDGFGWVSTFDQGTQTFGDHIPCIASVTPGSDPYESAGMVDILFTPVSGEWPIADLGNVGVFLTRALPSTEIDLS